MKRFTHLFQPLMIVLCVVLTVGMPADGAPAWPGEAVQVPWRADEEARRLADDLSAARTRLEAEAAILQILERLGVGVYNHLGLPRVPGNERGEDDFWLYDFQVAILAEAFLRSGFTALNDIVESWRGYHQAGWTFGPQKVPTTFKLFDALQVEQALRALRRQAEEAPEEARGLLIRLFDALGDREQHPFNLLDEPEETQEHQQPSGPGAAMREMMRGIMEQELAETRQEAEQEGDAEGLAVIDRLMSDEGMEAMMRGDIAGMISAALGDEAEEVLAMLGEAEQELAAAQQEADTPEQKRMLESTAGLLAGLRTARTEEGALELLEQAVRTLRDQRDHLAAMVRRTEDEHRRNWPQDRARLPADAAAVVSQGISEAEDQLAVLDLKGGLWWAQYSYDSAESALEEAREEKRVQEESGLKGAVPTEEEAGSTLMLDPVQVMLLHLDLMPPRPYAARSFACPDQCSPWSGLLLASTGGGGIAGACRMIGQAAASSPDLFGALQHAVWETAGAAVADAWSGTSFPSTGMPRAEGFIKGHNWIMDLTTILSGAIETLGTEATAEVAYTDPEDRARGAMHLLHRGDGEERGRRHARVKVNVEYLFDHSAITQQCGPLAGASLPSKGPMKDMEVRYRFPQGEPLETRRDGWWKVALPDHIQITGADGTATGRFFPAPAHPDLGGRRMTRPVDIRINVLPTADASAAYNPAAWGLGVARVVFQPHQLYEPVMIEYHEPLPYRGRVTFKRTVRHRSGAVAGGPTEGDPGWRSVDHNRNFEWILEAVFEAVDLNWEGNGGGRYRAEVNGNWHVNNEEEAIINCPGPPHPNRRLVSKSTEEKGEGQLGTASGEAKMALIFSPPRRGPMRYRLASEGVFTRLGGRFSQPGRFGGRTTITITEKDCDGQARTRPVGETHTGLTAPGVALLFRSLEPPPAYDWPVFDRDAERLNDSVSHRQEVTSPSGNTRFTVVTDIHWDLERIHVRLP
jgi:hypothetical protein